MVIEQGMSDKLRDQVFHEDGGGLMFDRMTRDRPYSDATAAIIDTEVAKLMHEAADRARVVIKENRSKLKDLADRLLKEETIDEAVVAEVLKGVVLPDAAKLY
jgi:cell division protease FtsH